MDDEKKTPIEGSRDPFDKASDLSFTSNPAEPPVQQPPVEQPPVQQPPVQQSPDMMPQASNLSFEADKKVADMEAKLSLAEQEKKRLHNDNEALLKSKESLEQQIEEWKMVLEDSESRYSQLQENHKKELEDVRKAGHDTLAIIVEEYKEQSRLAVQQERERSQQMLAEALGKELEKMEKVLESKSQLLVTTLNEEQVKSVQRTQDAINEVRTYVHTHL
jgi:chromosome segregation ATPase